MWRKCRRSARRRGQKGIWEDCFGIEEEHRESPRKRNGCWSRTGKGGRKENLCLPFRRQIEQPLKNTMIDCRDCRNLKRSLDNSWKWQWTEISPRNWTHERNHVVPCSDIQSVEDGGKMTKYISVYIKVRKLRNFLASFWRLFFFSFVLGTIFYLYTFNVCCFSHSAR